MGAGVVALDPTPDLSGVQALTTTGMLWTLEADTGEVRACAPVAPADRLVGVTQLPVNRRTEASPDTAPTSFAPAVDAPAGGALAPPSSPPTSSWGLRLEVDRVHFGYLPGVPVLHGVSLDIASGERVVVVGSSRAGKTTLATLLCGTHRATSGEVRIGGVPIAAIEPTELPRLVAMVAQEGHVFTRSVADNVRLARPDATTEDVRAALAAVSALAWSEGLPDGLDTVVGASHELTPPQAQQLGLARLLCADPPVVILDEATAELDPTAATRTERHLDRALAGRTVLTIAHRLDAAARADRVVVMDAGTIVATGTHSQLLEAGGSYAQLWAHWTADRYRSNGQRTQGD